MLGFLLKKRTQIIVGEGDVDNHLQISFRGNKYFRNLCELAYNGAVWGRVSEAVVEVIF